MSSLRIQKCLCTEFQLKCKIRKLLFKDNLSAQLAHHLIFGLVLLVFDFQWGAVWDSILNSSNLAWDCVLSLGLIEKESVE